MSLGLENTIWPEFPICKGGKELLGKMFSLADNPDPNSGKELAREVFTEDGVLIAGPMEARGSEAISKSRERAWDVITSRRHEIFKVYVNDKAGLDLLLLGQLVAGVESGKTATQIFTTKVIMGETASGLRIKHYESMADPTPIKTLLQNL